MILGAWLTLSACCCALAQQPQVNFRQVSIPRDAVNVAVKDILQLAPDDQKFQQYVWFPRPSATTDAAWTYTLNACISRSPLYAKQERLYGGALYRFDWRQVAPVAKDLAELRDINQDLARVNWYFHTIRRQTKHKLVQCAPYKHADGKTYSQKWVPDKIETVVTPALHAGPSLLLLQDLTGSRNPIMRGDQLIMLANTTLNGGLYYKLRKIPEKFEDLLKEVGADPKLADVEALLKDGKFNQDRTVQFVSGVTDKVRVLVFARGNEARPTASDGVIMVSLDASDDDVEVENDAIRNVLAFQPTAMEVIYTLDNGLMAYALYDAAGARQDSVPDNITHDIHKGFPGTLRLEPSLSCIGCHGQHDGVIPFRNDLQTMLESFDIYDDPASKRQVPETLQQLALLFAGDPARPMKNTRDNHAWHTYRITGVTVPEASRAIYDVWKGYFREKITPQRAMYELGYDMATDQAAANLFNQEVPFIPSNRHGIHPEDPIVHALRIWDENRPARKMAVHRFQFEQIYSDLMLRVLTKQTLDQATTSSPTPESVP